MTDIPDTQTANALDEFGGVESFALTEMAVPEPEPDEIVIEVHTAGVGVWDPAEREGKLADWMPEEPTFPYVLGSDGSGTVAAVGDDVDDFSPGDSVYASEFLNPRGGFYSEYVPVKADHAASIPDGLSMTEAGALPVDALTAFRGLRDALNLRAGETIGIFGASGGVGHLAVQLAQRMGATVLAVASGNDGRDLAKELGAAAAVRGRADELEEPVGRIAPNGLDTVLVCAHGDGLGDLLSYLREGGRMAWPNGVRPEPRVPEGVTGSSYDGTPDRATLDEMNARIAEGPFRVHVAERFDLADAGRAHDRLDQHYLGKLALKVGGDEAP